METFKKLFAEFCGTCLLVFVGCGSAMITGVSSAGAYLLVAFAFGLALIAAACTFGSVSGGHFNPAVSFAMLICGRISLGSFFAYSAAQILGGTAGAGLLRFIFYLAQEKLTDQTKVCAANGVSSVGNSFAAALLVEMILTFIFVFAVLFTAHKPEHKKNGAVICGFVLTGVHLVGIGLTGTSVNPARSFGPALISALTGGSVTPLVNCWVFFAAPLAGAALAAMLFRFLNGSQERS